MQESHLLDFIHYLWESSITFTRQKRQKKTFGKCKINDKNPCGTIKALMQEPFLIESSLRVLLSLNITVLLKVRKSLGNGQK